MFVFLPFRWFKDWGIKMTSEKEQRKQRREQIGDNLDGENDILVGHGKCVDSQWSCKDIQD